MKKIRLFSSLVLLLCISSCTSDDLPVEETQKPQTQQQKASISEGINTQISKSSEIKDPIKRK